MGEWGWFIIIQKTRPLIGLPNPEEELRLLEEKANATYGVYKEKLDTKEKLLAENQVIEEEKKALLKQIESEQGNVLNTMRNKQKYLHKEPILKLSWQLLKIILQKQSRLEFKLLMIRKILNRNQL